MLLVAEGRRHHPPRGMIPIGVEILGFVQRQVLDQRLPPNPLSGRPRPANSLMRLFAAGMHHVKRHAGHIGDHDRAVGGLALHLGRARIGVAFGAGVALGDQLGGQFGHHIAVLGMDHGQTAKVANPFEGLIHFIIVDHQRALIGHEMLERGHARLDRVLHILPHLLAPPSDGHMIRVIAMRPARFVVPHLGGIHQPLTLPRQHEIHDHRGAARHGRPRAGFEIVGGIGAHEGHL